MPNTRFSGTPRPATSSVSGSPTARQVPVTAPPGRRPRPSLNASANTVTSGTNRNSAGSQRHGRSASSAPRAVRWWRAGDARRQRRAGGACAPGRPGGGVIAWRWPPRLAARSWLIQQQHEGDDQHHHGDRGGAGVVVLLELVMISSGVISLTIGMLPAMKMTEPYSPSARAKASESRSAAPAARSGGSRAAKVCQRVAPSVAAPLPVLSVHVFQHRLHRAHDEGQADEHQRHEHARGVNAGYR